MNLPTPLPRPASGHFQRKSSSYHEVLSLQRFLLGSGHRSHQRTYITLSASCSAISARRWRAHRPHPEQAAARHSAKQ
jgi:hypothetical protein